VGLPLYPGGITLNGSPLHVFDNHKDAYGTIKHTIGLIMKVDVGPKDLGLNRAQKQHK
jgi:hypothetical protein